MNRPCLRCTFILAKIYIVIITQSLEFIIIKYKLAEIKNFADKK